MWPPFHGSMAFHMEGPDPVHHPAIARSFTTRTLPRTSRIAETYSRITPLVRFTAVVHRIFVLFVHATPASVQSVMSNGPYWLFWTRLLATKKPEEHPL